MLESIVNIFKQLGVDATIWYQLIVFVVLYPLLKVLFWNKLKFVIELRESKTTKLEAGAKDKFDEAEKLSKKVDEKISHANDEAQTYLKAEKVKALDTETSNFKAKEKVVLDDFSKSLNDFQVEMNSKKETVLSEADTLSKNLVERLS